MKGSEQPKESRQEEAKHLETLELKKAIFVQCSDLTPAQYHKIISIIDRNTTSIVQAILKNWAIESNEKTEELQSLRDQLATKEKEVTDLECTITEQGELFDTELDRLRKELADETEAKQRNEIKELKEVLRDIIPIAEIAYEHIGYLPQFTAEECNELEAKSKPIIEHAKKLLTPRE